MSMMKIHGNHRLMGEVTICGAKNSTVALIPATILSDTPVEFDKVPDILDVHNLMLILQSMNVPSEFSDGIFKVNPTNIKESRLPSEAIKKLRASYYFMGALLGRFHRAIVSFPGGDNIGPRPIDQHIRAFEALGADVTEDGDTVYIDATKHGLKGGIIDFEMVSVGATINAILAATKADGVTEIHNVAKEPEIVDIVSFLNSMGAKITGAGTDDIRIEGVKSLSATEIHTVIPDRIEAGTYLALAAAIGDGILVKNVIPEHLKPFTEKLTEMGLKLEINDDSIFVPESGNIHGVQITTEPFPGFATDWQQPITPLLFNADSDSVITDTIYPKRKKHIHELKKMGAIIKVADNNQIIISPSRDLHGAIVSAGEIRAGASLLVAGLMANGETLITHADHILRGYDNVVEKLAGLNANVELLEGNVPSASEA
ncbi:UDP-N-acetylglucosamine 1-carboxyvinyltransferase [Lactobacillus sanfranciscensis]|uniref:UDP-N-acetylglucosamine 1-carboxyvinyltransferase n=1 Tax=Fructilactobacillus sanfranciscensis (strain TMW 1.1304) TaxID=714313 RepID=G2KU44_FRUST|nr:UDP-N-acetylglucosamine 1-carboxyvinyltransferase [Fructilactobacillus sanfranciscensis]AEN98859.1 UDP-N-acetylglucosamine 1-carboxyvinyltransferase 2 [Fructilactobacillus sanfranciscensis TMW 1.1304]NDR76141.1 UDP-N-acetylglucosamine 1-carboxyvinyltransferase [Fructilactobacillus sanfranciscensis]NDR96835.1 UDP-N-acetylglucosamine 1-carboxyvinyltransferase [Fructilactobacillus sanfranciscensis]NDS04666.1 UDP-N-acetylglucosamine 1-carboxyvinyltransferase [Fructilactobacillus sanfranciscensis